VRVIDVHVHLCRTPEQERTVFPKQGWPLDWYWANPEKVIPYMDAHGISEVVTANIMVTARMIDRRLQRLQAEGATEADIEQARAELGDEMKERVRVFNTWACELARSEPRIVPFVLGDPVLFGDEVLDEVARCQALGARGIKVHPNNCGHYPDDPRMHGVYDYCATEGLPVLTCSNGRDFPLGAGYACPRYWRPVLERFSDLKLVLAHFNEGLWDERLELAEEFPENVWFDISGGLVDDRHPSGAHRHLEAELAPRIYRKAGVGRMMFGSDEPASGLDVNDLVWQVLKLSMTDDEKEKILWGNAAELLDLPA
jgi:predicted TIM-barrel fold metal-dependent hydrolase